MALQIVSASAQTIRAILRKSEHQIAMSAQRLSVLAVSMVVVEVHFHVRWLRTTHRTPKSYCTVVLLSCKPVLPSYATALACPLIAVPSRRLRVVMLEGSIATA
jgi:hypothetical protein